MCVRDTDAWHWRLRNRIGSARSAVRRAESPAEHPRQCCRLTDLVCDTQFTLSTERARTHAETPRHQSRSRCRLAPIVSSCLFSANDDESNSGPTNKQLGAVGGGGGGGNEDEDDDDYTGGCSDEQQQHMSAAATATALLAENAGNRNQRLTSTTQLQFARARTGTPPKELSPTLTAFRLDWCWLRPYPKLEVFQRHQISHYDTIPSVGAALVDL
ncbi:hypothetical protein LSTR_LSTR014663 [Laodelphax striatellus]|uniref:Uncharacterized protein n=1 Tax=Laodelphax striatellus TaxID=195883 RepID=A0A482WJ69_LAOST|nr:hypothetical protein LSTR_LSTR014663 [Laodelphax striatellus]